MAKKKDKGDAYPLQHVSRYKAIYKDKIVPQLKENLGKQNVNEIPKLEKIIVNVGIGEASRNVKLLEHVMGDLIIITGQKPKVCIARKSVSNFKLREGMPIGAKVTLRGNRMWDFYDRLVNIAMPRIRDFRGSNPDAFDGRGNYNFGLEEQTVFPEIRFDKVDAVRGMNITFVTSADSDEEGYELMKALGFPFQARD